MSPALPGTGHDSPRTSGPRTGPRGVARGALLILPLLLTGCGGFGDETVEPIDETPTWVGEVSVLLASRCATCHTSPPRNGAPAGFRFDKYNQAELGDGTLGASEKAPRILARAVNSSEMPFGGPPLSGAQKDVLRAWIEGGTPFAPPDLR